MNMNQTIPIQTNLASALRRLRKPDECRKIWIDLLCINQENLTERNQQVALMGEIYAQAEAVRVWLGEIHEFYGTVEDLEMYEQIARNYCAGFEEGSHHVDCAKRPDFVLGHGPVCQGNNVTLFHYDHIFNRPWFQRVWVVQEVWNAQTSEASQGGLKNRVTALCGKFELPWHVIVRASLCLYRGYIQNRHATMPALW